MIKNYLKIAWRNLLKNKSFSFINILGLAIGIAACMIIFIYVNNELTFDQYNVKADRIARVTAIMNTPESDVLFASMPAPLAGALKRDCPEVESTVRLESSQQAVKYNNEMLSENEFYYTEQNVFSIFNFDFLEGFAEDALRNPHSIVITETISKKYFSQYKSALGKTMICNGEQLLVTGVVKDRPANSDMQITALLFKDFSKSTSWLDGISAYTFILFKRKPDLKNFVHKLDKYGEKNVQPELDAQNASNYKVRFELEPLSAVHFSLGKIDDTPKGNKQFNYAFSLLAVFILIIALLNYINLSTAKSTERAKEVGIRKVSGALPFQLMGQFLFESFLLISIAWIAAFGLVQIGLPFFNKLLQTRLAFHWGVGFVFMVAILLATLVIAGLYPAFVLSGFKPVIVLKGSWRHSAKGVLLRKTVTIIQFVITAALIMGTTVIYNQMKFVEQKNLGFSQDQLLNIFLPIDSTLQNPAKAFQDALRSRPEIRGITIGNGMIPGGATLGTTIAEKEGKKRDFMCRAYAIDPNFLPLFQIQLIEGRNLSDSFGTDKKEGFLVNEAFVKSMGWKSAIGQPLDAFYHKGRIVGVVKNFYYNSLHKLIEPLVLFYNTNGSNTTTVKIKPQDIFIVKKLFSQYFPTRVFDYSFVDEMFNKEYRQDKITMSLFNAFTILAILVSCLGLYGLVALIAVQRTKEIGIRKVLGASLQQLLSVLTKDFMKLIFYAMIISLPIAGFVMHRWLANYAYHVELSWWMFLIPVLLILLITLTVISREIIKTALMNPVKSLRTE
jgi:putative ABC transport system permease protein